ncbi:MAG: TRAFs-binding domain-containing protein, partial [Bacteroidota bacterium]
MNSYCFVLMPFGLKEDSNGMEINFDDVYHDLIEPSIIDADLIPIRADGETVGGIIHKPMFERLMLCDFAIADLTSLNANVFYELGIRHGLKPHSTTLLFAEGTKLPFDVGLLRACPYQLTEKGKLKNAEAAKKNITSLLVASKEQIDDSPVFQLFHDMPRVDLEHLRTDLFKQMVNEEAETLKRLQQAKKEGVEALRVFEESLGDFQEVKSTLLMDVMLAYQSESSFEDVVRIVEKFKPPLSANLLVQQRYGMALGRE